LVLFKKDYPSLRAEILDYYFATRGAKGLALREVKLIVVGRGGAGKTSLIKRLKGDPFDPQALVRIRWADPVLTQPDCSRHSFGYGVSRADANHRQS
jgi:hypothetical protein